ncbi:MAG TPA: ATP-binding protein [Acidimicrobiales bacterium]|jgi:signal transduction histidine kinase
MTEGTGAAGWLDRIGSVRLRLTLAAALVTAIAVALAGWLLVRSVEDTQMARLHDEFEKGVDQVADKLQAGERWDSAVWNVQQQINIVDENGNVVGSNPALVPDPITGRLVPTFLGDDPRVDAAGGGLVISGEAGPDLTPGTGVPGDGATAPAVGVTAVRFDVQGDVEEVSRHVDTDLYGPVTVKTFAPTDEIAQSVDAVTRGLWLLLPGLVGVVALVAWWLAGRALRPVEAIRLEAEAISGDTIHRRLPEPASDDEIGRLARTMNAMLGRLDLSARKQRQFVSDASHELRSPVAAIRTDLEVALHEGDQADWPTVARAVLVEESRLETLLGDLLVLASDDESAAAAQLAMVDMAQVATDEVARGRRVPVALDLPETAEPDALVVAGVASRLERVLANLVDNAARHASTEVRVTVSRREDRVRVVVDDDGPGISPIDRERIFERFTRLDHSRARDRGGAGLGLAVVRSVAARHGGYVWADQSPLGGARFTLELPAVR